MVGTHRHTVAFTSQDRVRVDSLDNSLKCLVVSGDCEQGITSLTNLKPRFGLARARPCIKSCSSLFFPGEVSDCSSALLIKNQFQSLENKERKREGKIERQKERENERKRKKERKKERKQPRLAKSQGS